MRRFHRRVPEPAYRSRALRVAPALLAAFWLLPAAAAASDPPPGPQEQARSTVDDTANAVLGVLRDPTLPLVEKQRRVEALAEARFDFDTISRLVLARNWRGLTPQQRLDFVSAFKRHLSATYGQRLDGYKDEKILVESSRAEQNGDVTVRTRVVGAAADSVVVDYRLRQRESTWYVIDVIIEGVSLVLNFRTQTQEIISQVGFDGLLERLRAKSAGQDAAG